MAAVENSALPERTDGLRKSITLFTLIEASLATLAQGWVL